MTNYNQEQEFPIFNNTLFERNATHKLRSILRPDCEAQDKKEQSEPHQHNGKKEFVLSESDIADLEVYASILPLKSIAALLGCSEKTINNILERDKRARIAYNRGKAMLEFLAAATCVEMALVQKDRAMLMFLLKSQFRWKEVHNLEHNFDANGNSKVEIILQPISTPKYESDEAQN